MTENEKGISKLKKENERLKEELRDCLKSNLKCYVNKDKLIGLCEEFNIDWKKVLEND